MTLTHEEIAEMIGTTRETVSHRENLGCDLVYADASGDRIGDRLRVSGDHRNPDAKLMKLRDRLL